MMVLQKLLKDFVWTNRLIFRRRLLWIEMKEWILLL